MSSYEGVLCAYYIVVICWFASSCMGYAVEGTRTAARAIFLAPVWPVVVLYVLLRFLGRAFKDAFPNAAPPGLLTSAVRRARFYFTRLLRRAATTIEPTHEKERGPK